mmetsp:Transcript_942/g.1867  ORF Transcript_942/g.1867 Transcript_942/m.1867 type:complete len:200 (+) Transcript_942:1-600(+)
MRATASGGMCASLRVGKAVVASPSSVSIVANTTGRRTIDNDPLGRHPSLSRSRRLLMLMGVVALRSLATMVAGISSITCTYWHRHGPSSRRLGLLVPVALIPSIIVGAHVRSISLHGNDQFIKILERSHFLNVAVVVIPHFSSGHSGINRIDIIISPVLPLVEEISALATTKHPCGEGVIAGDVVRLADFAVTLAGRFA